MSIEQSFFGEYFEKSVQARFFKMKFSFMAKQGGGRTQLYAA